MDFSIDDLNNLWLRGKSRLDESGEYDISYYENYIQEDRRILHDMLEELLQIFKENLEKIDEKTQKHISFHIKKVIMDVYDKNRAKNPAIDFEKSQNYGSGMGYFKTHKYAKFIQLELDNTIRTYSELIEFMYWAYMKYKCKPHTYQKMWYEFFSCAKETCEKLGIHCFNPVMIEQIITSDPDLEKFPKLNYLFSSRIIEENYLPEDVMLTSIPYTVLVPRFSAADGVSSFESTWVSERKCEVLYNKEYYEELTSKRSL